MPVISKLTQNKNSIKVLVTRPLIFAESLSSKLINAGFIPELLPTIEFKQSPHQSDLNEAIKNLSTTDIAIFASTAAVKYGTEAILHFWSEPPNMLYAAIGPATQSVLLSYGLKNVLCPLTSPYESESLLAHPGLQLVQDKKIVIFRGNTGRNLLSLTLLQRGAMVRTIECYQRQIPKHNIAEQLSAWHRDPVHVTLATSAQVLENLQTLVGPKGWKLLQKRPMIVVGLRMQALAANLGVTKIIVAKDADDTSLITALMNLRDKVL